jgi:hypothetical protein
MRFNEVFNDFMAGKKIMMCNTHNGCESDYLVYAYHGDCFLEAIYGRRKPSKKMLLNFMKEARIVSNLAKFVLTSNNWEVLDD